MSDFLSSCLFRKSIEWLILITIAYFEEYNENLPLQLCSILLNIANFVKFRKNSIGIVEVVGFVSHLNSKTL